MKRIEFFLAMEPQHWILGKSENGVISTTEVSYDPQKELAEQITPAVAQLKEFGYAGQGICLGLNTHQIFIAPLYAENLPPKQRRQAFLYKLEEQLPLEAEAMSAQFIPLDGGCVLGLALATDPMLQLLQTFLEADIFIEALCPTSLLAAWPISRTPEKEVLPHYLLLSRPDYLDVLRFQGRTPIAWFSSAPDPEKLRQKLRIDLLRQPPFSATPTVCVLGEITDPIAQVLSEEWAEPQKRETDLYTLATQTATTVLDGQEAGWVNFRQDRLAAAHAWGRLNPWVRFTQYSAAAAMVLVLLTCLWRGYHYQHFKENAESRQTALYGTLFPKQSIPLDIPSRLASELRRLSGVRGLQTDMPRQPHALKTLRAVLSPLPEEIRLRILELRINPEEILVEGQTRSHSDAERLVQSLNASGLSFEPPRTERLATNGVSFTLIGNVSEKPVLARRVK